MVNLWLTKTFEQLPSFAKLIAPQITQIFTDKAALAHSFLNNASKDDDKRFIKYELIINKFVIRFVVLIAFNIKQTNFRI